MSDPSYDPAMTQRWHIGTIGFGYDDWRGVFYPPATKPSERLAFYARHFDAIEIDSTFHAAPSPERFARWAEQVPAGFRFALKTPRAITHESVLADALEPMKRFIESARSLGEKLGVVLLQYPPTLAGRLWPQVARFFDGLPRDVRYAVEFRQDSWFRDEVFRGLSDRGIAIVNAEYEVDSPPPVATADFTYVRLIGRFNKYNPTDHERIDPTPRLTWWQTEVAGLDRVRDVWCVTSNDFAGFSIATADRMRRLAGLPVATHQERFGVLF